MAEQKEPLPIKDIVNKVILGLAPGEQKEQRISEEQIGGAWQRAVGRLAGNRSKPTSLRKGKLVITVKYSSFLYDLTVKKRQILDALNKELGGKIKDIQFRIGETGGENKGKGKK